MDATGRDPLPYGLAANSVTLETLMGHAVAQGILTQPVALEKVFVPASVTWRDE